MSENIEIIRRLDRCLSKCGRPVAPTGLASVDIYAAFFYQAVVPNQSTQEQPLEITGDTTFLLRAISGIQAPTSVYIQFLFPNGRYLQQALRPWTQGAGVGSNRYVLDREVVCEPGTKIQITGDTSIPNPGSAQSFSVLFEGVYRWYLKTEGDSRRRLIPTDQVAYLPRIFSTRNQNPMAPRWMGHEFSGEGEWFTYCNSPASLFAVPSAGGGSNCKTQVQTDTGFDFFLARFYYIASFDDGTIGIPYVRIGEGSGRVFIDDYVNASVLAGQSLPDWWWVPPGRDILVDLNVVASAGQGNITIQYFFEGFRRRTRQR